MGRQAPFFETAFFVGTWRGVCSNTPFCIEGSPRLHIVYNDDHSGSHHFWLKPFWLKPIWLKHFWLKDFWLKDQTRFFFYRVCQNNQ